ncbi:MAG: heavy metal-associated domain-containing protein [bacterium]|nr:heavy metal-associated domain-containing protein [bacterium]
MTHTYKISGMTCGNCAATIKSQLLKMPDVVSAEISLENKVATIVMGKHIATYELQAAISPTKKYIITEDNATMKVETRSWLETYKPILLIFLFITGITLLIMNANPYFNLMQWMNQFMAGFFFVFSFFKMLDIKGFSESFSMYDIIAKHFKLWGYVYVFIELGLGIAFLLNFNPFLTNLFTLIFMTIGNIGVIQSIINKRKIQCACLGAVFNLPMSTVTVIEDGIMMVMSGVMLLMM